MSLGVAEDLLDKILIRNFQPEMFNGDCQIYCDRCKTRHSATKKTRIVHVPEVLAITLKRFEFDPKICNFVKVNREIYYDDKDFGLPLQVSLVNVKMELFAVIVG